MRVLDASALLATLLDEPAADEVDGLLRDPVERPIMSALNVAEVVDRLVRRRGVDPNDVITGLTSALHTVGLEAFPVDEPHALAAGAIRGRHYDRRANRVSLADCVAVVTAARLAASLATSDPALARTARAEGVEVFPLPNTHGKRPDIS